MIKKLIGWKIIGTLKLLVISCVVQAQVTNGSFEVWENLDSFSKPVGWETYYSPNFYPFYYNSLTQDTISTEGAYSLKISPIDFICTSLIRSSNNIPTSTLGEYLSIFLDVRILSSPTNPSKTYLELWGNIYKNDSIVYSYSKIDTSIIENFTEIEIPIDYPNPDSISLIILGGAEGPSATDVCFNGSNSWIDNIRIGKRTTNSTNENNRLTESLLNIFPNPSNSIVHISQDKQVYDLLEIYDYSGQKIQTIPINARLFTVELTISGLYFAMFSSKSNPDIIPISRRILIY
ncbi:MAG: WW domain-containing protein [Bacteroidota bacterium]